MWWLLGVYTEIGWKISSCRLYVPGQCIVQVCRRSNWKFHPENLNATLNSYLLTFGDLFPHSPDDRNGKKHLKNWKKGLVDSPSRTNFRWKAPSVWTLLHKEECLPAFLVPRYLERFWKVHHVRTHQKFQNSVKRGGHPSPSCTPPHYQKFVPLTVEGQ